MKETIKGQMILKARQLIRGFKLENLREWKPFRKGSLTDDVPAKPDNFHVTDEWSGCADWLGTGRRRISKSPKRKT